jgi:peptide-methionine (S)-S-oxide reductase
MAGDVAVLAGGCFWCTEAVFNDVIGVTKVESGYTGGSVPNPTYKQVCGGDTGHAEAIKVSFDPDQIRYGEILDIFFATHDPTQLNRQGNDVGTQYRSAIFPQDDKQDEEARHALDRAQVAGPDRPTSRASTPTDRYRSPASCASWATCRRPSEAPWTSSRSTENGSASRRGRVGGYL